MQGAWPELAKLECCECGRHQVDGDSRPTQILKQCFYLGLRQLTPRIYESL